jgi:coiled-coil domain-containing protein 40
MHPSLPHTLHGTPAPATLQLHSSAATRRTPHPSPPPLPPPPPPSHPPAAAKVEALTVNTSIAGLRDTLAAVEVEVADREKLIERYETEIRQRNDAIDKKMSAVDRLNRKYEKMVAEQPEAEHMGPLHAEVHNLQKAIGLKREAIEALQKRWLVDQTALVSASNDAEVKSTKLREMESQVVLLNQKRIRMDGAIAAQHEEVSRLEIAMKTMHEDMTRINALIAKNAALSGRLAAATAASATAFSEELRVAERELATAGG